ncbi:Imm70 family immunity protein [Candidatus Ventrimonas sp. KK005]
MGLYLCIFDQEEEDICGVEVGLYSYFEEFRKLISKYINKGFVSKVFKRKSKFSLPMTTLLNHSDCDGSWSVDECAQLKLELQEIKQVFTNEPPDLSIVELKQDIFKFYGIKPENLFECFIDSDCEFLIDRLIGLCDLAIQMNRPIMFQ